MHFQKYFFHFDTNILASYSPIFLTFSHNSVWKVHIQGQMTRIVECSNLNGLLNLLTHFTFSYEEILECYHSFTFFTPSSK